MLPHLMLLLTVAMAFIHVESASYTIFWQQSVYRDVMVDPSMPALPIIETQQSQSVGRAPSYNRKHANFANVKILQPDYPKP